MMTAGIARIGVLVAGLALALPPAAWAERDSGAFLAGQAAAAMADYEAAARYFTIALSGDPANLSLIDDALVSMVSTGDFARAEPLARRRADVSGLAAMVLSVAAAGRGEWQTVLDLQDDGLSIGLLADELTRAWALVGTGQMRAALAAFDAIAEAPGQRGFGLYHKALALAQAGDLEGAESLFALPVQDGIPVTRRGAMAHAIILGQLGRTGEAADMLRGTFSTGPDPVLTALIARLDTGGDGLVPLVADARAGLAEVYYGLSAAISGGGKADPRRMIYARAALWLEPTHVEAILLAAPVYEAVGRADLAIRAYQQVPADDPSFLIAELGRAAVLRRSGQPERAAEVLGGLARSRPDMPDIRASLGDALRGLGRLDEAEEAYSAAIALYPATEPSLWLVHYTRGIARQIRGDWPGAEADYRRALILNPGEPRVLNHLGYSLVERGEDLEEALDLVERAARAEPQNGAIVDSLGWALFRLGRMQEAVSHLERAAALEAVDPVVNDHLGDAYWMTGRRNEARFQWQRALSFGPAAAAADRIRRKLEVGLDAVSAEEASLPVEVARDGG